MLRLAFCHLLCIGLLLAECPGLLASHGGGGEFGVKLCGREFIRAVIYTCGGSRWKRLWTETAPGRGRRSDDSTQELASMNLQPIFDSDLQQLPKAWQPFGQQTFKDSFNLNNEYNEYGPLSEDVSEYVHQVEEALRGAGAVAPGSDPWEKNHRRKRDFSIGLAGMCCKWGCTKTEISTLC